MAARGGSSQGSTQPGGEGARAGPRGLACPRWSPQAAPTRGEARVGCLQAGNGLLTAASAPCHPQGSLPRTHTASRNSALSACREPAARLPAYFTETGPSVRVDAVRAGVLDKPDLDLSKGGLAPKTDDQYGSGETSGRGITGGGNYRQANRVASVPEPNCKGAEHRQQRCPRSWAPPHWLRHRVMLLDSPKHTEKLVVSALTTVCGTDQNHAKNCGPLRAARWHRRTQADQLPPCV